jgi:energy coupling factor transporter S component ThiW
VAEVFGTGVIGGLLSYPIAIAFMGKNAGDIAFYAYVVPFLVSTVGGSVLAGILIYALKKSGAMKSMKASLEH